MAVYGCWFSLFTVSFFGIFFTDQGNVAVAEDVKIIGLFSIYESIDGRCGTNVDTSSVMTAEAVKWYIQQLNNKAGLPLTIGFEAHPTCSLPAIAGQHALKVMNRVLEGEKIIGIVGPELSAEVEAISPLLNTVPEEYRLVQVGFSTTAEVLTEKIKSPNYVRVVPNDGVQVEMMIQSMMKLNWSRIAIVHEDNSYGQGMASLLQTKAEIMDICVPLAKQLSTTNGIILRDIGIIVDEIVIATSDRQPVGGIVFIGTWNTATVFMKTLTEYSTSPPIVMLSEGSSMDNRVLRKNDGSTNTKTFGTLVLSPPYILVKEFVQYWTSVFTNASAFNASTVNNSWLREVYNDLVTCVGKNCSFVIQTADDMERKFGKQSPFLQYAILAAHVLVKAVVMLHETHCRSSKGLCPALNNGNFSGHMLNIVRGLQVNLDTDFTWSPDSMKGQKLAISNSSGDVSLPQGFPSYQLYNVQGGQNMVFRKVADLIDNDVIMAYENIRDYDSAKQEHSWPDVRKAQCPAGKRCPECVHYETLQESFIFEQGDVYVIGVAPIFDKLGVQSCGNIRGSNGYLLAESIRFAVLQAKARKGDFSGFFTNVRLGVLILNSCGNPAVIQRKVLNLHKRGLMLKNGTVVNLTGKIIGYVAEYTSTLSISIAEVLTRLKFVQISYASTSPVLSDRSIYPYFMRVVTPDDKQARAMIEIIKQLNFEYAQVVYSAGNYGEDGKNQVRLHAKNNSICIAQDMSIEDDGNPFEIYEKLKKFPHARVVVFFVYPQMLVKITQAFTVQMTRGEFLFIGSEIWARETEVLLEDRNQLFLGSYTVSLEMYQDNQLRQGIREIRKERFSDNPWSTLFIEEKNNCFDEVSFDKTKPQKCSPEADFRTDPQFALETFDTASYIAAVSLLSGAHEHLQKKCGTAARALCADFTSDNYGLLSEIKSVKLDLDGSGTKVKVFDENGDGNVGYRIYNIQKDEENPQKLVYKEIGRFPLEGTFTFEKSKVVYPTKNVFTSSCPNELACQQCFKEAAQGTVTSGPITGEMNKDNMPVESERNISTTVTILAVLLALCFGAVIFIGTFLIMRFRKQKEIEKDVYLEPTPRRRNTGQSSSDFEENSVYQDLRVSSVCHEQTSVCN